MDEPFDFGTATEAYRRFRRRGSATAGWLLLATLTLIPFAATATFCAAAALPAFTPGDIAFLFLSLCIAYAATNVASLVWIASDCPDRASAPAWVIVVLLSGPIGLLVYLLQRR